jgi:NhaP-type Na+/H+ or K+/H+ antiporter
LFNFNFLSAIVFFTIFSELYLLELGVPGLGTSIDFTQGLAMFFRMSLGAAAVGVFFGLGTHGLILLLNRRLLREENVVEVATIVTMAYLCYFVTDVVWGCSGVIGTLTYGVVINVGSSSINDMKLQEDFWSLVEHFLNTVLFTLGGMVWGEIIANTDADKQFTRKDWGYLFALYIFLILIRFFLMFAFYPITFNIGLRTNWQETVFSSYAGLRGAVGIALAIYIDNVVNAQDIPKYEQETNLLFGFVGGIAFLTLVINATTAGPLLKKLGLAEESAVRKKVIRGLHFKTRQRLIDDMVTLLSEPRFHRVNFAVVTYHIPLIQDLTIAELEASVRRFNRPKGKFFTRSSVPNLNSVTPFLIKDQESDGNTVVEINRLLHRLSERNEEDDHLWYHRQKHGAGSSERESLNVTECRWLFLELLRASYAWQVACGELAERDFLVHILNQSLDIAAADVSKGLPLDDFSHMDIVHGQFPMV